MAVADFIDVVRALSRTPVLLGIPSMYDPQAVSHALDSGIAATVALPATPTTLARALTTVRPPAPTEPRTYQCGKLQLDLDSFRVLWHDHEAHLSPRQFDLLHYLMAAHPRVATTHELVDEFGLARGYERLSPIRVGIRRLRDQLTAAAPDVPQPIETVYRVGYRIAGGDPVPANPRSDISPSTRAWTSSRTLRTPSFGSPAGSVSVQSM